MHGRDGGRHPNSVVTTATLDGAAVVVEREAGDEFLSVAVTVRQVVSKHSKLGGGPADCITSFVGNTGIE